MATPIRLSVGETDRNRPLLAVAVPGIAAALLLAVVGLPAADLHGPVHRAGVMDPLCGGTRALLLAARGDVAGSLWWNPLSLVLVVGAVAYLARTVIGLASGRWLNLILTWRDRRVWLVLVVAVTVLEVRQQSMREVLMRPGF